MSEYDVIIVGAGSVGAPAAMSLAEAGIKTLVIDWCPSPGQGENKHAIGGVRATHSDPAKITTCKRSIEIFSSWEGRHGDDIEWTDGGYTFPAYREVEEKALRSILPIQKEFDLNIDFVDPERMAGIVPGIDRHDLRGGTFSPDDGSASPLLAISAFYEQAVRSGCRFNFKERVDRIITEKGEVAGVHTEKGEYRAPVVIDAAGSYSHELCSTAGVNIPVKPDSHEGAITEPVKRFFSPMVVDLRPGPGSKNFYFYQNLRGQIVFCITPDPPIYGTDGRETSVFLPQVAKRLVGLLPRLKNIRVRRVWRGLYPMSPDGSPLVGWNKEVKGLLHATGMCGQGFMIGPGLSEVLARMVAGRPLSEDRVILDGFSPYRKFGGDEALR